MSQLGFRGTSKCPNISKKYSENIIRHFSKVPNLLVSLKVFSELWQSVLKSGHFGKVPQKVFIALWQSVPYFFVSV
jgi:hypothetical protein